MISSSRRCASATASTECTAELAEEQTCISMSRPFIVNADKGPGLISLFVV